MENDLISRAKTIETLKKTYCTGCDSYNGVRCRACWVDDAENVIDAAPSIKAEPKWISVKDELPETFANVLVCTKHEMLICHHDGDEWVITYDGEYAGYDYDITHWMPLPELPKEDE